MIELTDSMVIAGIILCFTFVGIFTEHFHGIERAKFAMAGGWCHYHRWAIFRFLLAGVGARSYRLERCIFVGHHDGYRIYYDQHRGL